jgi:hypothetical protein
MYYLLAHLVQPMTAGTYQWLADYGTCTPLHLICAIVVTTMIVRIPRLPALVTIFLERFFPLFKLPVDISYHPLEASIRCLHLPILMRTSSPCYLFKSDIKSTATVAHLCPSVSSHNRNRNKKWSLNLLPDQETQLVLSCAMIAG